MGCDEFLGTWGMRVYLIVGCLLITGIYVVKLADVFCGLTLFWEEAVLNFWLIFWIWWQLIESISFAGFFLFNVNFHMEYLFH